MHPAQTYRYANPSDFALFGMLVTLSGLVYSPFLLSVGMWLLGVAAIWHQFLNTAFERWNTMVPMPRLFWLACKRVWRNYKAKPIYWLLSAFFIIPALSGIWSEEHAFWLTNTRVRIPFITLPLTFASLPAFNTRQLRVIGSFFVGLITLTCIGVGINFYLHQAEVMELIRIGKPIPVPRSHIRFSLCLAFAILVCCRAVFSEEARPGSKQVLWAGATGLFLFLFIHFLSVRSGIVAAYAGLVVYFLHRAILQKKWLPLASMLLLVAGIGLAAVRVMPSLALKLSYQNWDRGQYSLGNGASYSDSGRIASLEAGIEIIKEHPLLGVGTGDLPKVTERFTLKRHPEWTPELVKLPHNQWLFIWASTGLLGLLTSLIAVLYWLSVKRLRKSALFVGFQAIALSSLIVEYTFETSIGAAFFLVNYCFLVNAVTASVVDSDNGGE